MTQVDMNVHVAKPKTLRIPRSHSEKNLAIHPEGPETAPRSTLRSSEEADRAFAAELGRQLARYRQGLDKLLVAIGSPITPRIMQRQLGAPYTVCWQVFQTAKAGTGLAHARHAPTPASVRNLLGLAKKHGVTPKFATELQAMADEFRSFTKTHAGDRSAFETLVSGVTPAANGNEQIGLQQRRDAYRNLSHIWGRQIETVYYSELRQINEKSEICEICAMTVKAGVRRLRADAPVMVAGYQNMEKPLLQTEPLDRDAWEKYGLPVIPQFCADVIPRLKKEERPLGWTHYMLAGNEVGLRGDAMFVTGGIQRGASVSADVSESMGATMSVKQPTGLLVMDWILHRSTFGKLRPRVDVYEMPEQITGIAAVRAGQRLAIEEKFTMLGRADEMPELPEVPIAKSLAAYGAKRMGWDLGDFDVFRVRIPFPVVGSTALFWADQEA